jgi:hypothetical protein
MDGSGTALRLGSVSLGGPQPCSGNAGKVRKGVLLTHLPRIIFGSPRSSVRLNSVHKVLFSHDDITMLWVKPLYGYAIAGPTNVGEPTEGVSVCC